MAQFDKNTFYRVTFNVETENNASLTVATALYAQNEPKSNVYASWGSAYLSPFNFTDYHNGRQWFQFFPSPQNSSQYIIRPLQFNGRAWLSALDRPVVANWSTSASYWSVGAWKGRGSYYLYNNGNTSAEYMAVDASGSGAGVFLGMVNPRGTTQGQLEYNITAVGKIDNQAFSTLPAAFSTTSTASTTATSVPAAATNTNHPSGTSGSGTSSTRKKKKTSHAGAIAGGVIGGVVALLIIAALVVWALRRARRRKQQAEARELEANPVTVDKKYAEAGADVPQELETPVKPVEAPAHEVHEMPADSLEKEKKPAERYS